MLARLAETPGALLVKRFVSEREDLRVTGTLSQKHLRKSSSYVALVTMRCAAFMDANYSVKWTAANRHGIFMHCVAAATYLKR